MRWVAHSSRILYFGLSGVVSRLRFQVGRGFIPGTNVMQMVVGFSP